VPPSPPISGGRPRVARFGYCSHPIPARISTTYCCQGKDYKLENGNGGDYSSFERDPEKIAEKIHLQKEVDRLKKELDWANKELARRRKLNGDERDADMTSETKIVEIVSGETVTPVPISWLWHGWLAAGKAGAKGTLKTTIALDLAARITAGAK
jgi:hypothetical protein